MQLSLPIRYRFSGVVTGKLTTLQTSASPTLSQQVDSFAQVLLLDEFMLFTCRDTADVDFQAVEAASYNKPSAGQRHQLSISAAFSLLSV